MPRRMASLAILALLVGQGLIATASLWHRHGPESGPDPAGAGDYAAACHGHSTPSDDGDPEPEPAPPLGDHDDCLICQIVSSQRIDAIERAAAPLAAPVARAPGAPEALVLPRLDHAPPKARGPPSFEVA